MGTVFRKPVSLSVDLWHSGQTGPGADISFQMEYSCDQAQEVFRSVFQEQQFFRDIYKPYQALSFRIVTIIPNGMCVEASSIVKALKNAESTFQSGAGRPNEVKWGNLTLLFQY